MHLRAYIIAATLAHLTIALPTANTTATSDATNEYVFTADGILYKAIATVGDTPARYRLSNKAVWNAQVSAFAQQPSGDHPEFRPAFYTETVGRTELTTTFGARVPWVGPMPPEVWTYGEVVIVLDYLKDRLFPQDDEFVVEVGIKKPQSKYSEFMGANLTEVVVS
ncbi:uncharacterized protein KY384_005028 [Bacidia gigantensis]|uniref:uncharacterized protein n=1 Tax=Bacidia gigantensis TaxID=2732470 RepID=UPI001D04C83D|nr:uncharacterized protein KY384_005028 [Bacidia gigantensis]KAG8530525.1 hypothetical protein KY384_005028 [Bacidia gigantensis]